MERAREQVSAAIREVLPEHERLGRLALAQLGLKDLPGDPAMFLRKARLAGYALGAHALMKELEQSCAQMSSTMSRLV